jgi:hypothetical protein
MNKNSMKRHMEAEELFVNRANFIENSTEIREMFGFAHPDQVLNAVQTYACHFYGSMLWDLNGDMAGQAFRSWNTCVKLAWRIPRSSHNYFVDFLASNTPSVRKKLLCQYVTFVQNLQRSKSREVRILGNIVTQDIRSVTGRNIHHIQTVFNLDPRRDHNGLFKLQEVGYVTPQADEWRLPLLRNLLAQRSDMHVCEEDTTTINQLIESLCTS